ncbi:Glycosyl hydrolase [Posidoniimonas polymericola]|uniref:Glycosyl hydrolase n=1 Tax=Posidoniimonas polymericola TaxID=2528002 RepID=A0A5C5YKY9_9BACT|nr:Gfo/Idh/MocA family oxidoreductase [Posidoniimonas polymericola]TWT75580.1 Glycosyl hydrolase [Posidoniimonas polymericola]
MSGPSHNQPSPDRRAFLKGTAAAASMAPLLARADAIIPKTHTGVDETLRIGLIGCGGRGSGAAIDALHADPNTKLVAMGDAFPDRVENALSAISFDEEVGDRVDVGPDQIFTGFDAYKGVIDSGVDVVLLTTPPHFRPQHFEYAVAQGKHCFVEKPVATDVPGLKQVIEASKQAKEKNLAVVSGLCWRYDPGVRATMEQIQNGAIGDIVAVESSYNGGTLWHRGDKPEWSRMEYQMRNWLYYTWLSGDIIGEQAIHSLDKTAWLLGDASPVKAMGMGGRQQRVQSKYGNVYDHFSVFYEYPTGQSVYFTCRQQDGCTMHVDELVHGTKGKARVLAHEITGENQWKYDGPKPSMYRVEHEELFRSLREGKPIDNSDYMINSTMIGIMGRMAAYTGKTLSWEQAVSSTQRLGPAEYAWSDVPEPAPAVPGVTEFV